MATKYRLTFKSPRTTPMSNWDISMYFGPTDAKAIAKKCFELGHSRAYDSIEIAVVTRHSNKGSKK